MRYAAVVVLVKLCGMDWDVTTYDRPLTPVELTYLMRGLLERVSFTPDDGLWAVWKAFHAASEELAEIKEVPDHRSLLFDGDHPVSRAYELFGASVDLLLIEDRRANAKDADRKERLRVRGQAMVRQLYAQRLKALTELDQQLTAYETEQGETPQGTQQAAVDRRPDASW
jgi:hypothetical protein